MAECKVRVTMPYEAPYPRREIYDLEQTRFTVFGRGPGVVVVEGRCVTSFDELKAIAASQCREGKMLELTIMPFFDGG